MIKLRRALGVTLIIIVLSIVLPFSLPRFFGFQIFHIVSDSMVPAMERQTVVFVRFANPGELTIGDIISFHRGMGTADVVTHRIVAIDHEQMLVWTKGDGNLAADSEPVLFRNIIGRVELAVPHLGIVAEFINSTAGKVVVLLWFGLGLWLIMGKTRNRSLQANKSSKREKKTERFGE